MSELPPNPPKPDKLFIPIAIREGMKDAEIETRTIDDYTAMLIATALHHGPDSAMYYFAATGGVDSTPMYEEITSQYGEPLLSDYVKRQLYHLGMYVFDHPDQDEVEGWLNPFLDLE